MANKPSYIETKVREFVDEFSKDVDGTQNWMILRQIKFLERVLEEQAAGFEKIIGEDENTRRMFVTEKALMTEEGIELSQALLNDAEVRNSFRGRLREQLKGMRGK